MVLACRCTVEKSLLFMSRVSHLFVVFAIALVAGCATGAPATRPPATTPAIWTPPAG